MKKLLVANWKSHKTLLEATTWMEAFRDKMDHSLASDALNVVIAPSEAYLAEVANKLKTDTALAAQNVSQYPTGKYTGETAASQLASMGVRYCIVGHSERRRYFNEDTTQVANKVRQCIDATITPIICVDDDYIATQAAALESDLYSKCLVAYEALSAIGTGKNVQASHVAEVTTSIKEVFGDIPVLYGGSVNASTVREYAEISDGWLVGSASLNIDTFWELVTTISTM